MKTLYALPLTILVASVLSCAFAQNIVLIDAARALAAHPAGNAVAEIQARQQAELEPVLEQLEVLQAKARSGQALTLEEQDQGETLITFLRETQERYTREILDASEPAVQVVNYTICRLAQENGYDFVLDGNTAGQNGLGLIVYASNGLDITQDVVEQVQAFPSLPSADSASASELCLQKATARAN